jgi:hypothetical protein
MHGRHRVPDIGQTPHAELGGQLCEFGRQDRRILGRELPRYPELSQMTMRVRHRHTHLPRAP